MCDFGVCMCGGGEGGWGGGGWIVLNVIVSFVGFAREAAL